MEWIWCYQEYWLLVVAQIVLVEDVSVRVVVDDTVAVVVVVVVSQSSLTM